MSDTQKQIEGQPQVGSDALVLPLPCPFCGKMPEVFPSGDHTDGAEMVECITDGCVNPHVSYYGVNVARRKWNTRMMGAATKKDRSAVKTLMRRAEFLESREDANGKRKVGTDLDAQEAKSLRHLLKLVSGQNETSPVADATE